MTAFKTLPLPEHVDALGAVLSNLDEVAMTDNERAEALVWAWEGMRAQGISVSVVRDHAASVDTLPKGRDVKQARCASKGSAVGNAETPKEQP